MEGSSALDVEGPKITQIILFIRKMWFENYHNLLSQPSLNDTLLSVRHSPSLAQRKLPQETGPSLFDDKSIKSLGNSFIQCFNKLAAT